MQMARSTEEHTVEEDVFPALTDTTTVAGAAVGTVAVARIMTATGMIHATRRSNHVVKYPATNVVS